MMDVVRQRFTLPADLNLVGIVVQSKFGSDARFGSCASAPRALSSLIRLRLGLPCARTLPCSSGTGSGRSRI
jgi:hypothetical protein